MADDDLLASSADDDGRPCDLASIYANEEQEYIVDQVIEAAEQLLVVDARKQKVLAASSAFLEGFGAFTLTIVIPKIN
jgi:hypothetical protein